MHATLCSPGMLALHHWSKQSCTEAVRPPCDRSARLNACECSTHAEMSTRNGCCRMRLAAQDSPSLASCPPGLLAAAYAAASAVAAKPLVRDPHLSCWALLGSAPQGAFRGQTPDSDWLQTIQPTQLQLFVQSAVLAAVALSTVQVTHQCSASAAGDGSKPGLKACILLRLPAAPHQAVRAVSCGRSRGLASLRVTPELTADSAHHASCFKAWSGCIHDTRKGILAGHCALLLLLLRLLHCAIRAVARLSVSAIP